MFKRAYISVIKNKGRTIILGLLLFVIANLVLSSISIKSATTEAMDQARISLGAEINPCDGTDAISQAVDKAVEKGVNVVIAAGNASYPDRYDVTRSGYCQW